MLQHIILGQPARNSLHTCAVLFRPFPNRRLNGLVVWTPFKLLQGHAPRRHAGLH